jgi:hypothetical protein
MKEQEIASGAERAVITPLPQKDRRRGRRLKMSRALLARPSDPQYSDPQYTEEVQTTLNASRDGLYFTTHAKHYHVGMRLSVTLGYVPTDPCTAPSLGEIVRIEKLKDGSFGIAVQILLR